MLDGGCVGAALMHTWRSLVCTGVSVCGGQVGGVVLLAESAFYRGLFPPGAKLFCMVWVTLRPKL